MKKSYIIDTNVLLQSPQAIFAFGDNHVIIPEVVLEELDRFKKESSENGANARQTARIIDLLREKGDLTKGIELPGGGLLRIELNFHDIELPAGWSPAKADNRILKVCKGLNKRNEKAILVTKDIFVRIKGDIIGLTVQDFQNEQVVMPDSQYRGRTIVYTTHKKMDDFYQKECLNPKHLFIINEASGKKEDVQLVMNEFVTLVNVESSKQTALGRFDGRQVSPLKYADERPYGIRPRNVGQRFMQEALMMSSEEIPLVIIKGAAGTAKTLFSLAIGLHKIMNQKDRAYRKILICRPNVKFDDDIGYLPGSETEKLAPFMRAAIDNLEILVDHDEEERYKNEKELRDKIDELFQRNIITTEAITYIRGRSIQKNWVMIDEAQNLTPKQIKGIVTRAGKGTKIILTGDPDQIDHPYLDSRTNGLSFASERMKGSPYCCQITLNDDECERSRLAFDSAVRMTTF
ncbi:PhoH family protein [Syntrophobotulus glycolicus DSM 8271]|uniref:PhoH family protein n=1 Tax=Syntrophobotulus glycolicus (strain DSM 8271 / FlGlyR) TaxID=645991 RepID=F0T2R6_SYNGF|nr:PhoH family protein [Syntrophobotulus glycolicus]ADY56465.1 PhoH family protein [Syntrophobotulus glycolicus DSM 8271]